MFSNLFGGDKDKEDGEKDGEPQQQRQFGSGFAASMFSGLQEIGTKIKTISESVADKAFSEFNREQSMFVQSKHAKGREAATLPWVGCQDEENVKQQILALSGDKRNFLRDPPPGSTHQFNFDYDLHSPIALVLLTEDPRLEEMRFALVPKQVSEEHFWRNYFYRVSLIKQSSELTAIATEPAKDAKPSTPESSGSEPVMVGRHDAGGDEEDHDDDDVDSDGSFADRHELEQEIGADLDELDATGTSTPEPPAASPQKSPAMTQQEPPAKSSTKAKTDGQPSGSLPEWEEELQKELQDFELDDELTEEMDKLDLDDFELGDATESWEAEVEEMLEQDD